MTNATQAQYTQEQITAWLRGLIGIAIADNDFSTKEQELIEELSSSDLLHGESLQLSSLEPIQPAELASILGDDRTLCANFLRTAVAMALVDGNYSEEEDRLIQEYSVALNYEVKAISEVKAGVETLSQHHEAHPDLLVPLKEWLDRFDVHDRRLARFLCKAIPSQCPFERDVSLFGRKIAHIPAMCKINPLYDQLVGLRFRALSYLADRCGDDVSEFC